MNSKEYLEQSATTLAEQNEKQKKITLWNMRKLIRLASYGNVADMAKREIYYQDSNAFVRFENKEKELDELSNLIKHDFELTQEQMDFLHSGIGCLSESGEIVEEVLSSIINDRPIDTVNMKEEVGDMLWYLAILCRLCGFTFEDAMETNIAKLEKRNKGKSFNREATINRDEAAEREILEK